MLCSCEAIKGKKWPCQQSSTKFTAMELAQAFLMVTHPRLGAGSLFHHMDGGIAQMIAKNIACDEACDTHLGYLFRGCKEDRQLRNDVGEVLLSPGLLSARRVSLEEEERIRLLGEDAPDSSWEDLPGLVRRVRKERQNFAEKMHSFGGIQEDDRLDDQVYILLGESCKLPLASDGCCCEGCALYHDFEKEEGDDPDDLEDVEEGWDFKGHVITSYGESFRLKWHAEDLLNHMQKIAHSGEEKASRLRKLAPLVSEALILQACNFPVHTEDNLVGDCSWDPCWCEQVEVPSYEMTMFVSFCHEYETVLAEVGCRMSMDYSVCLKVHRNGRLVRLTYNFSDSFPCVACKCRWCTSFPERIGSIQANISNRQLLDSAYAGWVGSAALAVSFQRAI